MRHEGSTTVDEQRSLAIDPPLLSAGDQPGPHLLGRVFRPDPRDWSLGQLMEIAEPEDSILQQTIEQVIETRTTSQTGPRTWCSGAG